MSPRNRFVAALVLSLLAGASRAAPAPASVDDVYRALGQGEIARAKELSGDLVAGAGDAGPRRSSALQARLDVLEQSGDIAGDDGAALSAAIDRFAVAYPQTILGVRFEIAVALARRKADVALARSEEVLAAAATRPRVDVAELRHAEASAAAAMSGKFEQARAAALAALPLWREQRGLRAAWHEAELNYLLAIASPGDKQQALSWLEAGQPVAIGHFGADSLERIKIDTERASVLVALGRNREALALREAVLDATRRRFGEASVRTAKAEAMIGASLQELGDYPSARTRYAHAEKILAESGESESAERALIAGNYGNLLQEMGEEEAALAQYRSALAVYGDNPQRLRLRAITHANIGNTEFRLRRYDDAIAEYEQALALREQSDGSNAPGLAFSLEGLGSAALALRRYADAERYFGRALAVRSHGIAPDHPTLSVYNFGLALAHWGEGHRAEAFRYAQLTARSQQALLAAFAAEFSERQSVAFRDILVPATALAVTIAAERGGADDVAAAWDLVIADRRIVARAEARRFAATRSEHDPALTQLRSAWLGANGALGDAWLDTTTTAERLAQLRAAAESAERALLRSGQRGEEAERVPAIAELAQGLPADGLLVAFSEGISGDLARELVTGDKPPPDVAFAFVLAADGRPTLQRLGAIRSIAAIARAWYQDLRNPATDAQVVRRDGLQLRQAVLDPLLPPGSARHLFVVPEGELFRASFAALPDDGHGYLLEHGLRVHTLAEEGDLLAAAAGSGGVLLAGAPELATGAAAVAGAHAACAPVLTSGFAPLPNALHEIEALRALLGGTDSGRRIDVLDGAAATKDRVIAALPQAGIIHLATHGFSVDGPCAATQGLRGVSLQPRGDAANAAAGALDSVSGLAFRGRDGSGTILGAGELSGLDLSRADWVALSACDSGIGPVTRNEGVFGMRRALRLAGARTVVMSLWPVDDAATADLMQALYRARFVDHRDVADSMATAMREVLSARRAAQLGDQPFYWAAFVSEGAWR